MSCRSARAPKASKSKRQRKAEKKKVGKGAKEKTLLARKNEKIQEGGPGGKAMGVSTKIEGGNERDCHRPRSQNRRANGARKTKKRRKPGKGLTIPRKTNSRG